MKEKDSKHITWGKKSTKLGHLSNLDVFENFITQIGIIQNKGAMLLFTMMFDLRYLVSCFFVPPFKLKE